MDWINIRNQQPKDGARVLTYFKDFIGIEIATYCNLRGTKDEVFGLDCFHNKSGFLTDDVTHWMSLPEPPESEAP